MRDLNDFIFTCLKFMPPYLLKQTTFQNSLPCSVLKTVFSILAIRHTILICRHAAAGPLLSPGLTRASREYFCSMFRAAAVDLKLKCQQHVPVQVQIINIHCELRNFPIISTL